MRACVCVCIGVRERERKIHNVIINVKTHLTEVNGSSGQGVPVG